MVEDFEHEQLRRNPQLMVALKVYFDLQSQARDQLPDFDGWVPRVREVAEVESSTLPSIHGKLIAFGFLKFDLLGRDAGIRYQLTPQGRQAIVGRPKEDDESVDDESQFAQSE